MEDRERESVAFGFEERIATEAQPRAVPAVHTSSIYEKVIKPTLDRIAGVAFTVVTLPVVLIIVPMIWAKLGRPAIFRQVRVGRFGEEFTVYKLRTMGDDRRDNEIDIAHPERRMNHKSPSDPRHTPLGRLLRKWSIDEIPQFWNIALGQMSIVGPRPELPEIVRRYQPWQHRRHEVKPGLTGLWQVSARGDAPMHEATEVDLEYVENVSFLGDASIILRTPKAALGSKQGH